MPLALAASLLLAFQTPSPNAEPTVLLRFQPPVGSSVAYVSVTTITQTIPGMGTPIESTTTTPMTLRAVSRKDGLTTLETKSGQTKLTVPANSPMASMRERIEKASSGLTYTALVDERGNVKSSGVAGNDDPLVKGVAKGVSQGLPNVSYPTQALKVGDEWRSELDMGKLIGGMAGGAAKIEGKIPIVFRLVAIDKVGDKTLARIATTIKGGFDTTMQGMAMKIGMDQKGETVVDVATGYTQSSSSVGDTDMTIAGGTMHQHIVTSMKAP